MKEHLSFEEIYEYVITDDITEENAERMYKMDCHIEVCDECFSKIQFLQRLKFVLDNWTAEFEGKLHRENKSFSAANRVLSWLEKYQGKGAAAMEVLVNFKQIKHGAVNNITQIITDGMEDFIIPNKEYNFNSALALPTRGIRGKAESSRGRRVKKEYGVIAEDEKTGSQIIVDSSKEDNRIVKIELKDINPEKIPLVMLINTSDEAVLPLITEPKKIEDNRWTAEFENLKKGKYLLMIEPVEE